MHSSLLLTAEQSLFANVEEAIVYLNLQADVGEEFPVVYLDLLPQYPEFAEIYLNLTVLGGECYSTFTGELFGEGEADTRWLTSIDETRWVGTELTRWTEGEVTIEGVNC